MKEGLERGPRLRGTLRQSIARFPVLTQPVHGLAQTHRQRGDHLQPLLSAVRKLAVILPSYLRYQQLGIPKDSGQRIIQFMPQHLAKRIGPPHSVHGDRACRPLWIRKFIQKGSHQQRDITFALAQCGQLDLHYI